MLVYSLTLINLVYSSLSSLLPSLSPYSLSNWLSLPSNSIKTFRCHYDTIHSTNSPITHSKNHLSNTISTLWFVVVGHIRYIGYLWVLSMRLDHHLCILPSHVVRHMLLLYYSLWHYSMSELQWFIHIIIFIHHLLTLIVV